MRVSHGPSFQFHSLIVEPGRKTGNGEDGDHDRFRRSVGVPESKSVKTCAIGG